MQLACRTQLRRAFEQDEIHVHYQPKFHLRTGSLQGVEALLRCRNFRAWLLAMSGSWHQSGLTWI